MGKLIGIATKKAFRGKMLLHREAMISEETGVGNDPRGKPGKRQVTVITKESWDEACRELGCSIPWTARRANLFIEGVELSGSKGLYLYINDAVLEIAGETTPCSRMDDEFKGLKAALQPNWRGGVICRVIKGGKVRIGNDAGIGHRHAGWRVSRS